MDRNPSDSTIEPGFLADLSTRIRRLDIILVIAIPMILAAVSQLSMATRRSLAFNPDAPTIVSAFTAHFVHFDAAHLYGNLLLYLLIIPMIYLLFTMSDCRRDFRLVVFPILLGFPFLLSGLNLLLPRSGVIIVGFSGLGMAFVGVLPVALFRFLEEQVPRKIGLNDAIGLFFLGAGLIAFRMAPSGVGLAIGMAAGLIALLFTWRLLRTLGPIKHVELGRALGRSGYVELSVTSPVLFLVAIVMAFPADPYRFGGFIDLWTHLLGYALGFTMAFVTVGITGMVSDDEVPEPPDSFNE